MKYRVVALCTISVHTDVQAESEEQALELAQERAMQTLCHSCTRGNSREEWCTSGELDGEPRDLVAEELS